MKLERTTFELSRELDFFDEKELEMQIGQEAEWWPVAILKELIDNALDACECAGVSPDIRVGVQGVALTVEDNGPGIPPETVRGSLDYLKRVSDKLLYVSSTRGQLGNTLKVVWAAPFVQSGTSGRVEVSARGVKHTIEVSLDRIRQAPAIEYATCQDSRETGTFFRVEWPAAEIEVLVHDDGYRGYSGKRVELNAMTADQFVAWLERKLTEHGVTKVVPAEDVQARAYRRARYSQDLEAAVEKLMEEQDREAVAAPRALAKKVTQFLGKRRDLTWDEAVWELAEKGRGRGASGTD